MFEKEAKESAKRKIYNFIVSFWGVYQIRTEQTCETVEGAPHFYQSSLEKMWQEGAEYGYKYKANEWHYVKDRDYPKDNKPVLCILGDIDSDSYEVGYYNDVGSGEPWHFETYQLPNDDGDNAWGVSAWKEISRPEPGLQMPMQEG